MAGTSRTLKLSILGDVDNLKKSLTEANNSVEDSSSKMSGFAGKAKLAFAAAGIAAAAYAGKLLVEGVKAAIEDEASQVRLANALKNVTGATKEQITATENFILQTSLASGVADDLLRPAYERLIRSTKDSGEAQKLTNLALDIAKAKNIDVTTVANALAKANDGQVGALKKLGITLGDNASNLGEYNKVQKNLEKAQLDANDALVQFGPKSKEYLTASGKVADIQGKANDLAKAGIDIFGELGKEFAGAAAASADTFSGKMDRLKIAFDEGKETIGAFILDAITPVVNAVVKYVIPAIQTFIENIGGKTGISNAFGSFGTLIKSIFMPIIEGLTTAFGKVKDAIAKNADDLQPLLDLFKKVFDFIQKYLAPILGGLFKDALIGVGTILSTLVTGFSKLVGFISDAYEGIKKFVNFIANNPVTKGISGAIDAVFGGGKAIGGPVMGGTSYLVGERGPELFTPNSSGSITPNNRLGGGGNTIINLNVTGAIDPESTARSIINVLNNSAFRGTGGASNLVTV